MQVEDSMTRRKKIRTKCWGRRSSIVEYLSSEPRTSFRLQSVTLPDAERMRRLEELTYRTGLSESERGRLTL